MYPRIYSPRSKYKDLPNLSKIIKNYSFRLASFLYFLGFNEWGFTSNKMCSSEFCKEAFGLK